MSKRLGITKPGAAVKQAVQHQGRVHHGHASAHVKAALGHYTGKDREHLTKALESLGRVGESDADADTRERALDRI